MEKVRLLQADFLHFKIYIPPDNKRVPSATTFGNIVSPTSPVGYQNPDKKHFLECNIRRTRDFLPTITITIKTSTHTQISFSKTTDESAISFIKGNQPC